MKDYIDWSLSVVPRLYFHFLPLFCVRKETFVADAAKMQHTANSKKYNKKIKIYNDKVKNYNNKFGRF